MVWLRIERLVLFLGTFREAMLVKWPKWASIIFGAIVAFLFFHSIFHNRWVNWRGEMLWSVGKASEKSGRRKERPEICLKKGCQ